MKPVWRTVLSGIVFAMLAVIAVRAETPALPAVEAEISLPAMPGPKAILEKLFSSSQEELRALGIPEGVCRQLAALRESEPAYTQADLDAYLAEVVPVVEAIVERSFGTVPPVAVQTRADVVEALAAEFKAQARFMFPMVQAHARPAMCDLHAVGIVAGLLGKYDMNTKRIYMLPRNLVPLLTAAKLEDAPREGVVKLLLAHELVHVLQDREVGLLGVIGQCSGGDAYTALVASMEGHAMLVQELVAAKLGLTQAHETLCRLIGATEMSTGDPALDLVGAIQARAQSDIYLSGRAFMGYHYQHGGMDRLWSILLSPPVKSRVIEHPETYSRDRANDPQRDWDGLLRGVVPLLGEREWNVTVLELGHMQLAAGYAQFPEPDRAAILRQVQGAHSLVVQDPAVPGLQGVIAVLEFDDAVFSPTFMEITARQVERNRVQMESSKFLRIEDFACEPFAGPDAERSLDLRFALATRMTDDAPRMRQRLLRVYRGNVVLEILLQNLPVDDTALQVLVDRLFGGLEAGAGATQE